MTTAENLPWALEVVRRALDMESFPGDTYEALALIERRLGASQAALKEADELLADVYAKGEKHAGRLLNVRTKISAALDADPQDDCPSLVRGDWEGL
jgi:hypothetical protein